VQERRGGIGKVVRTQGEGLRVGRVHHAVGEAPAHADQEIGTRGGEELVDADRLAREHRAEQDDLHEQEQEQPGPRVPPVGAGAHPLVDDPAGEVQADETDGHQAPGDDTGRDTVHAAEHGDPGPEVDERGRQTVVAEERPDEVHGHEDQQQLEGLAAIPDLPSRVFHADLSIVAGMPGVTSPTATRASRRREP
jgi:hypothetical protein